MKKILIGTHNKGKFKEISHLISKKLRKISPIKLKIVSPKETGKTFFSNARLKANFDFPDAVGPAKRIIFFNKLIYFNT